MKIETIKMYAFHSLNSMWEKIIPAWHCACVYVCVAASHQTYFVIRSSLFLLTSTFGSNFSLFLHRKNNLSTHFECALSFETMLRDPWWRSLERTRLTVMGMIYWQKCAPERVFFVALELHARGLKKRYLWHYLIFHVQYVPTADWKAGRPQNIVIGSSSWCIVSLFGGRFGNRTKEKKKSIYNFPSKKQAYNVAQTQPKTDCFADCAACHLPWFHFSLGTHTDARDEHNLEWIAGENPLPERAKDRKKSSSQKINLA